MQVSREKAKFNKRPASAISRPLDRRESLERGFSTAVIAFHESIAARLGLSAAEWKCLGVLQAGAMTAGSLAELSGFSTGGITAIVDRLERAKLVRREPNPGDRRSILIRPLRLASVERKVAPVFESLRKAMTEVADSFTSEQLAAIQVLRVETGKLRSKN